MFASAFQGFYKTIIVGGQKNQNKPNLQEKIKKKKKLQKQTGQRRQHYDFKGFECG